MTHPKFEESFRQVRRFLKKVKMPGTIIFIIMGILSTVWFLARVIPKPQRAAYPCMRAAFPVMTGFIVWLISVSGSITAFRFARKNIKNRKYIVATSLVAVALAFGIFGLFEQHKKAMAAGNYVDNDYFVPNQPMGKGQGIHPGRVVWIHNPDATNENCTNTKDDPFYSSQNTDQAVVDDMVSQSVLKVTGEANVSDAWDAIFKYFNNKKGRGARTFQAGEKIFIKINQGTASWLSNPTTLERNFDGWAAGYAPVTETSPEAILSILKELVDVKGINQADIYVGDPIAHVWEDTYQYLHDQYPDVKYVDKDSQYESMGRTTIHPSMQDVVFYSDKGKVMTSAVSDALYEEMENADYLINMAAMKAHARAGISLTAKNHFGSHTRAGADHLHPGLLAPENDQPTNAGYGKYRVLVDIMGHEKLGQNTCLYFVDGLWAGDEAVDPPCKFQSAPFNNDWSSSIFVSLDQVALESVCLDVLRTEFNNPNDITKYRPHYLGVDDYLHQAADPANWPEGITYDPEDDGTPIGSLGVHEHWNSGTQRQYSRNLGKPYGIELVTVPSDLSENTPFVAREATTAPVIDGDNSDDCWKTADWYPIDQTWIPYGDSVPESDFKGRFKVMWSPSENLLYYTVEIQDDAFIDGYLWPGGGYPNYDIVEIFLDEDHSGGPHVFDTSTENAENAFSYHIAATCPANGEVSNDFVVCDIAGTSWSNEIIPNYASHFPEFAMKKNGNTYIYEFSLQVHNDTYVDANPDASRVTLTEGKIMGMSVAYCDNDKDDGQRDNFFGSVWVTAARYNSHWESADDYGVLQLTGPGEIIQSTPKVGQVNTFDKGVNVYPNPVTDGYVNINFYDPTNGNVNINVYSVNGQLMKNFSKYKSTTDFTERLNINNLNKGVYLVELRFNNKNAVRRIVK